MTFAADPDPRFLLARPDLAELALEGLVRAGRYGPVRPMHGAVPVTDLLAGPGEGERISQLLSGEGFDVLDGVEGWRWGRSRRDGVVGWVAAGDLAEGRPLASHRIAEPGALPLNALLTGSAEGAIEIGRFDGDLVAAAERLLGVAHMPGGRSSAGTDCSGLVQQALMACGRAAPRWSDQQARLGEAVDTPRRGDLVIWLRAEAGEGAWTGHSALMVDDGRLIHATGHHGAVVHEALSDADARCRAMGLDAPVFRRI